MAGSAHPVIARVEMEFDQVERQYVEKVAAGHVADWAEYRLLVGRIEEVRAGKKRAVETLTELLKGEADE